MEYLDRYRFTEGTDNPSIFRIDLTTRQRN